MSKNYWFISDTHFQHQNILKFDNPKGFNSVEERDGYIIDKWNSVVRPGDYVYHLGDVFFGSKQTFPKLWSYLNGSKRLIVGNHDDVKYLSSGGFFKKVSVWKVWPDRPFVFTHVPIHESSIKERVPSPVYEKAINVHGHTHSNGSPDGPYRSVCVELNDYTPVNLEEL